ncbi:MAG: DUF1501 domain-containing protein [Rubrivivax sp.]
MPWALNLSLLGEAAAAASVTGYKALVCVFLYGGNDNFNTLVPYDPIHYGLYAGIRKDIALERATLLPLNSDAGLPSGRQMALAAQLPGVQALFNAGRCAVQLNVGPLMVPTTKAQFLAKSVPLPPKLFSHNDQQSVWQSLWPEGAGSGWGGRIGDLLHSANAHSTFTCISTSGNALHLAGRTASQYVVSPQHPSLAPPLKAKTTSVYGSAALSAALSKQVQAMRSHLLEAEHTRVMRRAVEAQSLLSAALSGVPALATVFDPANPLAVQLKAVASLIAARSTLGVKRQVFFVSLGGFDLHDSLPDLHPGLLSQVSAALKSFYDATVELGVANQVTAFTASDFGRTLASNGDGSDHGWGSHHFVVGGAVQGGRFFGVAPDVSVSSNDQVGQGRLLPSTAIEQFAAPMAAWFGVPASDMASVFPNIGQFTSGLSPLFG